MLLVYYFNDLKIVFTSSVLKYYLTSQSYIPYFEYASLKESESELECNL